MRNPVGVPLLKRLRLNRIAGNHCAYWEIGCWTPRGPTLSLIATGDWTGKGKPWRLLACRCVRRVIWNQENRLRFAALLLLALGAIAEPESLVFAAFGLRALG